MGRFNKGIFFGGILGAGLVWLNVTKKGREVKGVLLDHAAVVYEQVKETLIASGAWKDMTQNEYAILVKDIINKYAVKNGLAKNIRDIVERIIRSQWKEIRKRIVTETKNPL